MNSPVSARRWFPESENARLNHGSYGLTPKPVATARRRWLQECENAPEHFYRSVLADQLDRARETAGRFLGVDPELLTFTANATEAFRLLLSRLDPSINRVVLTDLCYGTIRQAIEEWIHLGNDRSQTTVSIRPLLLLGQESAITDRLSDACEPGCLLVVDQIPSSVPVRLPIASIVERCGTNVTVVVDGTHAAGTLPHPVPKDVLWFASLHKWCYTAKTCGVFTVPQGATPQAREQLTLSTRDYSPALSLAEALDFPIAHLGLDWPELRNTNSDIVGSGLDILASTFDGQTVHDRSVPMGIFQTSIAVEETEPEIMSRLSGYGVEVAAFKSDDGLALRVSGQPYVSLDDFDRLARALRDLFHEGKPCSALGGGDLP